MSSCPRASRSAAASETTRPTSVIDRSQRSHHDRAALGQLDEPACPSELRATEFLGARSTASSTRITQSRWPARDLQNSDRFVEREYACAATCDACDRRSRSRRSRRGARPRQHCLRCGEGRALGKGVRVACHARARSLDLKGALRRHGRDLVARDSSATASSGRGGTQVPTQQRRRPSVESTLALSVPGQHVAKGSTGRGRSMPPLFAVSVSRAGRSRTEPVRVAERAERNREADRRAGRCDLERPDLPSARRDVGPEPNELSSLRWAMGAEGEVGAGPLATGCHLYVVRAVRTSMPMSSMLLDPLLTRTRAKRWCVRETDTERDRRPCV